MDLNHTIGVCRSSSSSLCIEPARISSLFGSEVSGEENCTCCCVDTCVWLVSVACVEVPVEIPVVVVVSVGLAFAGRGFSGGVDLDSSSCAKRSSGVALDVFIVE